MARYSATFLKRDGGATPVTVHTADLRAATIQDAVDEAQDGAAPDFHGATTLIISCDGSTVLSVGLGWNASQT